MAVPLRARRQLTARAWLGVAWLGIAWLGMTATVSAAPRPLLWQVSDADNHIYLLGSFHMLTEADYPLAPAVEHAFDDAEALVFELSPQELGSPALGQRMLELAKRRDGKTLQSSLPPAMWQRLAEYAEHKQLPLAQWQSFQAWFVALAISMAEMQEAGLDSSLGLDRYFVERANKAGKPGIGLETGESQLQVFATMNATEQRQALQETLDKLDTFDRETRELHELWRSGDDQALYVRMGRELADTYPELYRRVLLERNRAWMPQVQALLDKHSRDDALVVVGAMHLLGPDGLVAQLRAKGYVVERK